MKHASLSYLKLLEDAKKHTDIVLPDVNELTGRFTPSIFNLYTLFYVLDFTQSSYLEVGPGHDTFLGYTTKYLKDMGPYSWLEKWNQHDFRVINESLIPENISLLNQISSKDIRDLVFTYNYRVRTKRGEEISLIQRTSYIVDEYKNILAAVGTVTDITLFRPDTKIVSLVEQFDKCDARKILHHTYYFPEEKKALLSKREIEVLKWICEGLNSKLIADKMNISFNTVNNHRRNMLQKTSCTNFASLLKYAINNGIL